MKMDVYFEDLGYERVSNTRITDLNAPTHQGIDGVYRHPGPPPKYIIADAKFSSSNNFQLKMTKDGLQLSDDWIFGNITGNNRLLADVPPKTYDEILLYGYERCVV